MGYRINEYHNKKAVEKRQKLQLMKKRAENEQVELAFDSTNQKGHDNVCTIDGKTFLAFTIIHALGTLEHPVTSLTMMMACLM